MFQPQKRSKFIPGLFFAALELVLFSGPRTSAAAALTDGQRSGVQCVYFTVLFHALSCIGSTAELRTVHMEMANVL